jgi:hypothetical protein
VYKLTLINSVLTIIFLIILKNKFMKNSYLNLWYLAITVLFLGLSSCSSGSSDESKPIGSTVPDNINTLVADGKVYNGAVDVRTISSSGGYSFQYTTLNSTSTEVAYLRISLTNPPTKNMTYNVVDLNANRFTATDAQIYLFVNKVPNTTISTKSMMAESGTLNVTMDGSKVIFKFSNLPTSIFEYAPGTKVVGKTIMAGHIISN